MNSLLNCDNQRLIDSKLIQITDNTMKIEE